MKPLYTDVLDDYFDALLEDNASKASQPSLELIAAPNTELVVSPTRPVLAPYAEPDAAERRQALEALLAQVAELKEEETATSTLESPTLAKPEPIIEPIAVIVAPAAEPEPIVVTPPVRVAEPIAVVAPIVTPTPVMPAIVTPTTVTPTIVTPTIVTPTTVTPTTVTPTIIAPAAEPAIKVAIDLELQAQLAAEQALAEQAAVWRNMDTEPHFQVLFFEVAGMTFAVPLTHLGGIYQVAKQTSLFGKPDWFSGVQTERDRQIYAVDTARWAMPGHTAQEEYQYLVTLGESHWGLGCHQLKGTELLTREQIKWRTQPGARPWLAGMVKERMCALLHVDALVALLEQGKNIDGQQV